MNVLRACRFFALFSGEEKRGPKPAKTQRSGSQQSRLSLGRPFGGAQWTRGPPSVTPISFCRVAGLTVASHRAVWPAAPCEPCAVLDAAPSPPSGRQGLVTQCRGLQNPVLQSEIARLKEAVTALSERRPAYKREDAPHRRSDWTDGPVGHRDADKDEGLRFQHWPNAASSHAGRQRGRISGYCRLTIKMAAYGQDERLS